MRRTRDRILLSIVLITAAPTTTLARTAANPVDRLVRDLDGSVQAAAAAARAQAPAQVAATLVPLPSGAVQLDSTTYDLQDFGSLGTRIVMTPSGMVHAVWQDDFCELDVNGCPPNLNLPQPYPQRAMAYAYRDLSNAWTRVGKVQDPSIRGCCLTELYGGFGTIAVLPSGRVAISQHMDEDGCDLRGDFYLEDVAGGSTYTAYLTPIVSPSYLFPQVTALPNGSYVVLGEVPRGGQYDETNDFRVSVLPAAGAHFICPTGWQCGAWTQVMPSTFFPDGRGAFPTLASASDGRAGVAVTDFGGNVFLVESSNATFQPGTITIRNLTNYTDALITAPDSTSTQYRAYVNCHLAYNDTIPNVVWSELQARRVSGSVQFFDYHSRIQHWSSTTGITTVYQVQPGEADHYDDIDLGLSGPIAGFNTISVDWPQVGFSANGGETYVAWLRFSDAEIDPTANAGLPGIVTGVGFGDIAASVRRSGQPWSPPQNLTQTPSTDERFFSLAARNPDGRAHVVFQASATNQAGCALIGDRGSSPGNLVRRIAYLERPLQASVVGVEPGLRAGSVSLRAFPNPARGRVRLALEGGASGAGAPARRVAEIFAVTGRRVARVTVEGGDGTEWDARDAWGRALPSGVYMARLEGDAAGPGVKFLLLH